MAIDGWRPNRAGCLPHDHLLLVLCWLSTTNRFRIISITVIIIFRWISEAMSMMMMMMMITSQREGREVRRTKANPEIGDRHFLDPDCALEWKKIKWRRFHVPSHVISRHRFIRNQSVEASTRDRRESRRWEESKRKRCGSSRFSKH